MELGSGRAGACGACAALCFEEGRRACVGAVLILRCIGTAWSAEQPGHGSDSLQSAGEQLAAHLGQALRAHHGDVGEGDGQDEGGAEGGGSHDPKGLAVALEVGHGPGGDHGVGGKEGSQVGTHSNGTHAWTTPAVGDAEGLVQVQVAHVSPDLARGGQPHLPQQSA